MTMSVTAISGVSTSPMAGSSQMAQIKQKFDALGSALQSGDLDEAKKVFAELQKNAPAQSGNSKNSISSEMENLGKSLDSGDLKEAQEAYSRIQSKMSQGSPAGAPAGGRPHKGGHGGGSGTSSASTSTSYDKMDLNKDGTVSQLERMLYEMEHPGSSTATSATESDEGKGNTGINTYV
jgi:hypothetical protein